MELSSLIGKQILSPAGKQLGYVKGVLLSEDLRRLSSLCCVSEEENEFFLPAEAVRAAGDALVADGEKTCRGSGTACPVGKAVFAMTGNYLGGAERFDPETGLLTVSKEGKRRTYRAETLSVGDVVLVRTPARRREKRENAAAQGEPSAPAAQKNREPQGLIGMKAKKSVPVAGGTLIGAGETVTPAHLKRAREANRLLELKAAVLTK